jgi:hypothetical protein
MAARGSKASYAGQAQNAALEHLSHEAAGRNDCLATDFGSTCAELPTL